MADAKTRYWEGVLYPENMREDWQEELPELIKLPFAYCVHDMDVREKGDQRKKHVHLILVWNGPTTYTNALRVFSKLSAQGKVAINKIEMVDSMRCAYDYLIHDTEDCRKKGKYQYPKECRIEGNNFDIGFYEQLSLEEKKQILRELINVIKEYGIYNAIDLDDWIIEQEGQSDRYFEAYISYSHVIQRYLDACYQKCIYVTGKEKLDRLHELAEGKEVSESD